MTQATKILTVINRGQPTDINGSAHQIRDAYLNGTVDATNYQYADESAIAETKSGTMDLQQYRHDTNANNHNGTLL